ncbi:TPA: phage baseplate assembly protein [Pseudomonas putida]|uniref:phage baseplate assembly protein V n=1 Tax=Pseudomonas putida TaxID=303 RepID=UPI002363D2D2|nr:phage baseplate assembly protein V [Pseudomonas putida]MDD2150736.1 phage baseplate assembly protein V [Pseudomonas putida]HDS1679148.1 phage baseplate assembly protein [Pseudomonas putida]
MKPIRNFLARGVVALVDAGRMLQGLQMRLTADEVKDGMEHFEPYGFTSNPQPGAEGLAAFLNGDRSHGVVICVSDRRFRLQGLESGEVALYTDEGDFLHFKRGRVIEVQTATFRVKADTAVEFDTPLISTTGRIVSDGDQIAAGVSTSLHVHEGSDKKPVKGG